MASLRYVLLTALAVVALALLYPHKKAVGPTGEDVTEIVFLGPAGSADRAAHQSALDEFERRNPQYRVRLALNTTADSQGDPTRFLIGLAGGEPPDVIFFDRFAVAEWASRGGFTALDPYIQRDQKAGLADAIQPANFYHAPWEEAQWQGAVYGIPNNLDTRVLFYNRDLLTKAGFVDQAGKARPPKTWEELEEYAVKLTERDERGNIKVLGYAPNFGNTFLYLYGWMNGGEFVSPDHRTITFSDPKIVGALEWMVSMYDRLGGYAEVDAFQMGFQMDALDPFITGKVAMKIDGVWQMSRLAAFGQNLNYDFAPPPMPAAELAKGRAPVTWLGGWVYAIPSTAQKKDAAWELIRWLSSREANAIMADQLQRIESAKGRVFIPRQHPNRVLNEWLFEQYIANAPVKEEFKAGYRLFNELIADARYRPITPVGQVMWRAQIDAMEQAFYKQQTPREALRQADVQVQARLDEFHAKAGGKPMTWGWFFAAYAALVVLGALVIPKLDRRFREAGEVGGRSWRGERAAGILFASPWIIGFVGITAGAMLFSLVLSFCRYDLINPAQWVGLDNYRALFFKDELFWQSLGNTLFMVIGVPLGMAASLGMAVLLIQEVRGVPVWRTFFYLPSIVPIVASSILWIWIFNPQAGLLNSMLDLIGIVGPNWLGSRETSKISLILMGLWTAGGGMIIWIAGLKAIPESYYEAASLDGAGAWNRFRHVTLPMLTPYIFFNLIMGLIGTLKIFEVAYIMTNGGPVNSTTFYVYHLFNQAFRYLNMGQASAMAWVLFAIVAVLTLYQLRLSKRWVHYDQG